MGENNSLGTSRRSFLKAAGSAASGAALANVAAAHDEGHGDASDGGGTGEMLVGVSATTSTESVERELPASVTVKHRNETLGYVLVGMPDERGTYGQLQVESQIASQEGVRYVEPNERRYPASAPDDRLYDQQYAPQMVRGPEAWETTRGSDDVTIAIVDTGVVYDHPDLKAQFGENKGKDFVDDDDDPMPPDPSSENHGTHVAGIAAATGDNGTGVAGISDSRLLSCRVLGDGGGSVSDIADAIRWATDQGADLINMSLGGGGFSQTMKNAVSYAVDNGTLPVCAAGNSCDEVGYPAAYNECVAVSAIDSEGDTTRFSQHGPKVDVTAPGKDVLSCWGVEVQEYGGKYNAIPGTSMSCPVVTGVAALGLAANPDLTVEQLRQRIKDTAVDVGLPEEEQGAGRVDALRMVGGARDPGANESPTVSVSATPASAHVGQKVYLSARSADDADGYVESWRWDLGDGTTAEGEQAVHSYDSPGEYTATVTVTDDDGAVTEASVDVSVEAGQCGDRTETTELTGTVPAGRNYGLVEYTFKTDDPCQFTATRTSTSPETDVESAQNLMVQRKENSSDIATFDRCSSDIEHDANDVRDYDTSRPVEIGMARGRGVRGDIEFTFTVEERGFGDGGGGGDNEAPTASFTPDSPTAAPGETITFDASGASDPDGSIDAFEWTFGDGTTDRGETASHAYGSEGEFTVELTVTDDDGATDTATTTVTVTEDNAAPTASFTLDDSTITTGESVTVDAGPSSDPDGAIESFEWAFGDGATATGETASHAYDDPGEFGLELTVTDDDGATDSATKTVTVEDGGGGGGGGECGDATETRTETGDLDRGEGDIYTHSTRLDDPCGATVSLTGDDGLDCDLYLTLDGREPSTGDFDRRSWNFGPDEEIGLDDDDVDADTELGVLVDAYSGSGGYTLTVEETGTGSGDGGGGGGGGDNEAPTAAFTADPATVEAGTSVTFDASASSDPDGSIASFEWAFDDGATATGRTVSHAFGASGEYDVELTVTDGDGATDTATETVTVEDGGGGDECGTTSNTTSVEDELTGFGAEKAYSYSTETGDPCRVTLSLDGPDDADFDLYATDDGTTPSTFDYDYKSTTQNSQERITVENVDAGTELGVLVDAWDGEGEFTLSVEELGR